MSGVLVFICDWLVGINLGRNLYHKQRSVWWRLTSEARVERLNKR